VEQEEDADVDVVTVDTSSPLENPMIVLNPNIFEPFDRTSINMDSAAEVELFYTNHPLTELLEDHPLDYDLRHRGKINIIDPSILDPILLRDAGQKLDCIMTDMNILINNKSKSRRRLRQLFYDIRMSIILVGRFTAVLTRIHQKLSSLHKFLDVQFEKILQEELYFVRLGDESLNNNNNNYIEYTSTASLPRKLDPELVPPPLPFLNFFFTKSRLYSIKDIIKDEGSNHCQIYLSMNCLAKYILLFTYFRRIRSSKHYTKFTVCLESYYYVLERFWAVSTK
jgi:hypothetical protein